jgi:hypothetical protein
MQAKPSDDLEQQVTPQWPSAGDHNEIFEGGMLRRVPIPEFLLIVPENASQMIVDEMANLRFVCGIFLR